MMMMPRELQSKISQNKKKTRQNQMARLRQPRGTRHGERSDLDLSLKHLGANLGPKMGLLGPIWGHAAPFRTLSGGSGKASRDKSRAWKF